MINKVLQTIEKYGLIKEGEKIVVGVSGGPDSMCLLNILNNLKGKLKIQLVVAHINHMIREEAEEETRYVQNYCNKIGIDCFIKRINVLEKSNKEKIGTEEAGRKARYDFFEEVFLKVGATKIATAHNANDNAETVLMNIFRGVGTSGLKGIEPIREGKYIRPLIECERQEIENYCQDNKLEPKIDKSNFENIYTRNKIRNILIPQIKSEFNPNIVEALNKLSSLARQENEFIQKYTHEILERELIIEDTKGDCKENNSYIDGAKETNEERDKFVSERNGIVIQRSNDKLIIDLKKFNNLDGFIKSKIVLLSIQKILGSTQGIEKVHVDDIIKLCSRNIGNKYLTPNKNIKVLVNAGKIYFIRNARA